MESGTGNFFRDYLPAILGNAQLGGIADIVTGAVEVVAGAVTLDSAEIASGAKEIGKGTLKTVGLPEDVMDFRKTPTGNLHAPKSIGKEIADAHPTNAVDGGPKFDLTGKFVPGEGFKKDREQGMHGWHGATNAALTNKFGITAVVPLLIAGVAHEVADPKSMSAESRA